MIKSDRFLISQSPYAVDPGSLRTHPGHRPDYGYAHVSAVWFRRVKGVLRACAGELRSEALDTPLPATALEAAPLFRDGRYGGDCRARWDGATLWCLEDEETRARYKDILVPMLANFPAVPPGYDGWWRFES